MVHLHAVDLTPEIITPAPERIAPIGPLPDDRPIQYLSPHEILFDENDPKTHLLMVESGVICISSTKVDGSREIIELVFPGNVIGLGFLKHHIHRAVAVVEASVSYWPHSSFDLLTEHLPSTHERHALATEREFAHRRKLILGGRSLDPVKRLASFLLVISSLNEVEGRDPHLIIESPPSGVVAGYLKLDMDTLSDALAELGRRNLIAFAPPQGVRLLDIDGLRELADGESEVSDAYDTADLQTA